MPVSKPKHFWKTRKALVTFELDIREHLKFFFEAFALGSQIELLQNSILFVGERNSS
jgi:hypothetical protein